MLQVALVFVVGRSVDSCRSLSTVDEVADQAGVLWVARLVVSVTSTVGSSKGRTAGCVSPPDEPFAGYPVAADPSQMQQMFDQSLAAWLAAVQATAGFATRARELADRVPFPVRAAV